MNKRRGMIYGWLAVAIISSAISASMSSCVHIDAPAWSHFYKVRESGWSPEEIMVFEPESPDSTGFKGECYDFTMILRSTSRQPVKALPVAISVEDNNGIIKEDTIIIDPSKNRDIVSRNKFGVNETTLDLLSNIRVDDGFSIVVSPLLDADSSQGLLNVGIEMRERVQSQDNSKQRNNTPPKEQ